MEQVAYALIPGFRGYRAGTDGSIWSACKQGGLYTGWIISDTWRQLKAKPRRSDGRKKYALRRAGDDRQSYHYGGALVLLAFVGPAPEGMECCHNNGDTGDDSLTNVRWDTHVGNKSDEVAHGTRRNGEAINTAKLNARKVQEIRRRYASGETNQAALAREFNVARTLIGPIVRREIWRHVPDAESEIACPA